MSYRKVNAGVPPSAAKQANRVVKTMIRGAIEAANTEVVQGWLFCSAASLRDKVVLAFVDARCVGASKLDIFRRDLKEAGLGDGYAGFSIPIALADPGQIKAVVVRLEGSDLALLQKDSVVRTENVLKRLREVA
jgi:hypothetical protein